MKNRDARRQLCKMVGEIAGRLRLPVDTSACTCGQDTGGGDVSDAVIEEMWRRLTHPDWGKIEGHQPHIELKPGEYFCVGCRKIIFGAEMHERGGKHHCPKCTIDYDNTHPPEKKSQTAGYWDAIRGGK